MYVSKCSKKSEKKLPKFRTKIKKRWKIYSSKIMFVKKSENLSEMSKCCWILKKFLKKKIQESGNVKIIMVPKTTPNFLERSGLLRGYNFFIYYFFFIIFFSFFCFFDKQSDHYQVNKQCKNDYYFVA